jgi:hypothetical protein
MEGASICKEYKRQSFEFYDYFKSAMYRATDELQTPVNAIPHLRGQ